MMLLSPRRSWVRRHVLLGLFALLAVACLNEGLTGSGTVTGVYTLRSVNGSPLPYTLSGSGANQTELVRDAITLFQGGTYARERELRITANGQVTIEATTQGGSYELLGKSVSMRAAGVGTPVLATIDGNTMTIVEAGVTSVFSK